MQSYIEKQNQTILTYKYFVFYTKGDALPYLAYQSTDKIQKYTKYGVLVNDLDGINIKEWIKVSATSARRVKRIR